LKHILSQQFFNRPTLHIAQDLLGKFLVCKNRNSSISGMITEVEAYVGSEDKASHASKGATPRTKVMFGKPGYWYVYLVYGMHHCLNIVTEEKDYPAAILIRGVEGISGPGRVTKHFKINIHFNNTAASKKTGLWIEDRGLVLKPNHMKRNKRIGVDYAGKWKNKLWRFSII